MRLISGISRTADGQVAGQGQAPGEGGRYRSRASWDWSKPLRTHCSALKSPSRPGAQLNILRGEINDDGDHQRADPAQSAVIPLAGTWMPYITWAPVVIISGSVVGLVCWGIWGISVATSTGHSLQGLWPLWLMLLGGLAFLRRRPHPLSSAARDHAR